MSSVTLEASGQTAETPYRAMSLSETANPESSGILRLRSCFARDPLARDFGAVLKRLDRGLSEIHVADASRLKTDRGDIHTAVRSSLTELAAHYAAAAWSPAGASLVTLEQSLELGSPQGADQLTAISRLDREGRSLLILRSELVGELNGRRYTLALLTSTILVVRDRAAATGDMASMLVARAAA